MITWRLDCGNLFLYDYYYFSFFFVIIIYCCTINLAKLRFIIAYYTSFDIVECISNFLQVHIGTHFSFLLKGGKGKRKRGTICHSSSSQLHLFSPPLSLLIITHLQHSSSLSSLPFTLCDAVSCSFLLFASLKPLLATPSSPPSSPVPLPFSSYPFPLLPAIPLSSSSFRSPPFSPSHSFILHDEGSYFSLRISVNIFVFLVCVFSFSYCLSLFIVSSVCLSINWSICVYVSTYLSIYLRLPICLFI